MVKLHSVHRHSFLAEVRTNAAYMRRIRKNNLEIRKEGSSCLLHLFLEFRRFSLDILIKYILKMIMYNLAQSETPREQLTALIFTVNVKLHG